MNRRSGQGRNHENDSRQLTGRLILQMLFQHLKMARNLFSTPPDTGVLVD